MKEEYFDFYNIDEDGSEDISYDIPEMPVYIRDGNLSSLKDYTFKAHFHSDWEFVVVLSGSMKYSINGKIIAITEGECVFVNSNHIHFGFSDTNEDCSYICLIVHPSLFCNNPFIERNYISPVINSGYQYLIIKDKNFTDAIIDVYYKKQNNNSNLYFEIQQNLFSIAFQLYSLVDKLPIVERGTQTFSSVKKMLDFIANNYSEKITLSDIAKSGHICNNSCINIFKKFTNSTPMEYLNRYRIEKACELLNLTDKTISEIALDCGFSGSSYFTEMFKKSIGITPRQWRDRNGSICR